MEVKTFDLGSIEFLKFNAVVGRDLAMEVTTLDRELPGFVATHENDEIFIVLSGRLEIDAADEESNVLTEGRGALIPRNTPHLEKFTPGTRVIHITVPRQMEVPELATA